MNNLAAALGYHSEITSIKATVQLKGLGRVDENLVDDIKAISLQKLKSHWSDVYPILPKKIPPYDQPTQGFYEMYRNNCCTDFLLSTGDGEIRVHSNVLYLHGGDYFQTLLSSDFKEKQSKTIAFDTFSLKTIKSFLDFLYLGPSSLPATSFSENMDIWELFQFGHMYQVPGLVDHCTNIMSLKATSADVETIKAVAADYQNAHLTELANYLA